MLAHALSRPAYGDVARSLSLALAVAQLTMAGLAPAVARAVAGGQDDGRRRARAAAARPLTLAACSAAALLVVPLAAAGLAPWRPGSVGPAVLVAAVYAVYFALKCVLFALDEVALYARWELIADGLFFAALALLVLLAPGAALLVFALAYGVFVLAVWRRLAGARGRLAVDGGFRRYAALATVATYASVARLPLVTALAGALAGSRDAAGIAGVVAIVTPLFLVPQAAGMLTFAAVARAPGADHSARVGQLVRAVAVCSAAVVLPLALLARPVVELLLGPSYRNVAASFVIVALGSLPQLVATPVANAISGEGAVGLNAALASVSLAVALGGAALLVPAYHVVGAACALAASMSVLGLGTLAVGRRRFALRLGAAVPA